MTPDGRIKFGRLTHLLLENFKAFGRLQRIPIRPITLIYGKNNSGKSSIIQALLYAEHVRRSREMEPAVIRKDEHRVLEGGLPRLTHGHGEAVPRLGWEWENPGSATGLESGSYIQELGDIVLQAGLNDKLFFEFKDDEGWLCASPDQKHPTLIAAVTNIQRWLAKEFRLVLTNEQLSPELRVHLTSACSSLEEGGYTGPVFDELFDNSHGLIVDKVGLPPVFRYVTQNEDDWNLSSPVAGYRATSLLARNWEQSDKCVRHDEGEPDVKLSWGIQSGLEAHVDDFITKRAAFILFRWLEDVWAHFTRPLDGLVGTVHYLSAVRTRPERVFLREPEDLAPTSRNGRKVFTAQHGDWIFQAAAIADANRWLRTHHELIGDIEIRHETLKGKNRHVRKPIALSLFDRQRKVELGFNEVGFGVSQFLPVLLASFARQDSFLDEASGTVLIEEPEAHVHPALQSEIADLFIRAVSRKGRPLAYVIAETHSEHLLLRIMRRIREGKLSPKMVSVLYVENAGKESFVREMPLNENGELIRDWPGGFFEEGLRELLL